MSPEQYEKIYRWFTARPAALTLLRLATKGLPLVVAGSYGVLLAGVLWQGSPLLGRTLLVPAVLFVGGTALRSWRNAPRPYEKGITPLIPKDLTGQSWPSRHSVAAGVIAAAWLVNCPPVGAVVTVLALCIAVSRVLAGVHSVWDVSAGLLLGFVGGLAGMLL